MLHPGLGTELDNRFEAAYAREETFFVLAYLRQEKGQAWLTDLVEKVVRKHGAEAFKLPGVNERLDAADVLSSCTPSWGILTYGDMVDQRMKLGIVGLESAPVYFTDTPDKGFLIASWQQPDGTFLLPAEYGGGVASKISLEDDKLRAFQGLPRGAYGVWITDKSDAQLLLDAEGVTNIAPAVSVKESTKVISTL